MYSIKELRLATGLTQKAFAEIYEIPLSTLRKWEQGESTPASYFVKLLNQTIPSINDNVVEYKDSKGCSYFYNKSKSEVLDSVGNSIRINEDLEDVKKPNLILYLEDLFDDFYHIQERFDRDCRIDKKEDIIWSKFE